MSETEVCLIVVTAAFMPSMLAAFIVGWVRGFKACSKVRDDVDAIRDAARGG